jgi:hypothetical protein
MATTLTSLQQNWISRGIDVAQRTVDLADDCSRIKALYYSELIGSAVTDGELQELPSCRHLTNARVIALETAIEAMLTALGDYTSGQLGNFLKATSTL